MKKKMKIIMRKYLSHTKDKLKCVKRMMLFVITVIIVPKNSKSQIR